MTRRIVAVSAGLSQPSSTRMLADRLLEAARGFLAADGEDVAVEVLELREHAGAIANNLVTGFAEPGLAEVIRRVTAADGIIAVTPVFNASYSGLFKSFFDLIDADALTGVPVLVAATGGTERHSLVLEHALRPLFSYLHAVIVPTAVYAASSDWGGSGDGEGELMLRVGRAARELANLVAAAPARADAPEPDAVRDGFVPFDQLLRRQGIRP